MDLEPPANPLNSRSSCERSPKPLGRLPAAPADWPLPSTPSALRRLRLRWIRDLIERVDPAHECINPATVFAGLIDRSRKHVIDFCRGRHRFSEAVLARVQALAQRHGAWDLPLIVLTPAFEPKIRSNLRDTPDGSLPRAGSSKRPAPLPTPRQVVIGGTTVALPAGSTVEYTPNGELARISFPRRDPRSAAKRE